jgi:hypothetical protein
VLLEHRLERERDRPLARVEVRVELVGALLLEEIHDRGGVRHDLAVDVDERQLLARRLAHVAGDDLVLLIGDTQVRLHLHHEGARVGQTEGGAELVDLDHGRRSLRPTAGLR